VALALGKEALRGAWADPCGCRSSASGQVFDQVRGANGRYRLMARLLYGCGLRVVELTALMALHKWGLFRKSQGLREAVRRGLRPAL
jgi:hypothetical protein